VLSGRGLCDGLITRPEESYRLWRVVVCDQETSKTSRLKSPLRGCEKYNQKGCNARKTNNKHGIPYYVQDCTGCNLILIFVRSADDGKKDSYMFVCFLAVTTHRVFILTAR